MSIEYARFLEWSLWWSFRVSEFHDILWIDHLPSDIPVLKIFRSMESIFLWRKIRQKFLNIINLLFASHVLIWFTPLKINMEPKNPPIDKENHLNQTSMNLGFHPLIFWLGFPGWVPNFWWFLRDYKKTLAVGATSAGARVALWKTGSSKAFLESQKMGPKRLFWLEFGPCFGIFFPSKIEVSGVLGIYLPLKTRFQHLEFHEGFPPFPLVDSMFTCSLLLCCSTARCPRGLCVCLECWCGVFRSDREGGKISSNKKWERKEWRRNMLQLILHWNDKWVFVSLNGGTLISHPKCWSFLVGKPMVVGYPYFWKYPNTS